MSSNGTRSGWLVACLTSLLAAAPLTQAELNLEESEAQPDEGRALPEWKESWAVEEGFSLELDTHGYHYPTAIAFVPSPGPDPKDPLYFVTELRGKIKVVTNDRTVYTFAEGFLNTRFYDEVPKIVSEFGLAGICLDPAHGYVFVTFAYEDGETVRNNLMRFDTTPETFALKPKSQRAFTEVFKPYTSGITHQIGGCQVRDRTLYVSVGDGWDSPLGSQQLDTLQGKVIRMTLDGKPAADNPFYQDDDILKASNYVWAYGFRNPFGLEVIDGKVMVAENGVHSDRFLQIRRGQNYLWDGRDRSIAANADYVFLDAVGPAQMDYFKSTSPAFPERFREQFYVALSSVEDPGVMRVPYDLERDMMRAIPDYLMKNMPGAGGPVTGIAFGPDGLYVVPLMPMINDQGAVLKLKYEPANAHPITLEDWQATQLRVQNAESIMTNKGCFGCHTVESVGGGIGGRGGTKGPLLGDERMVERISQRISSPEFLEHLEKLDAQRQEPYDQYVDARREVAEATGRERVRVWMKYQIMEPRFDGPFSGMPNLGVNEAEAETIAAYLLDDSDSSLMAKIKARIQKRVLNTEERRLTAAVGAGIVLGLPIWFVLSRLLRLRPRRRS